MVFAAPLCIVDEGKLRLYFCRATVRDMSVIQCNYLFNMKIAIDSLLNLLQSIKINSRVCNCIDNGFRDSI